MRKFTTFTAFLLSFVLFIVPSTAQETSPVTIIDGEYFAPGYDLFYANVFQAVPNEYSEESRNIITGTIEFETATGYFFNISLPEATDSDFQIESNDDCLEFDRQIFLEGTYILAWVIASCDTTGAFVIATDSEIVLFVILDYMGEE